MRRMPRAETLLQPQAQRLDELSERLRRGLTDRASVGREQLAGVATRLSPRVLMRAHSDATQRLARARLAPSLVERPLALSRDRLASLARLASQLHPERPLERGYAIVRNPQGTALTDRSQAERERSLTLQFRDGEMSVGVGDAPPPAPAPTPAPPKPARKARSTPPNPRQDDLFG